MVSALRGRLPAYEAPPRRRARQALRTACALTRPEVWPLPSGVGAFWWDGHPNFGDALTPWLLPHLGVVPVLARPSDAQVAGVGSILEMLPEQFAGVIWGSGSMYGLPLRLPDATVAAVRGPLTRDLLDVGQQASVALGDPGLLVAWLMRRPSVKHALGVVPHGSHRGRPEFAALASAAPGEVSQVLTYQPVHHVLRHIASCEAILTTSLHGLIVADSFGIPAAWAMPEELMGGRFKFEDYEKVVTPGRTREIALDPSTTLAEVLRSVRTADADRVRASQDDLMRAAALIPRRPLGRVVLSRGVNRDVHT